MIQLSSSTYTSISGKASRPRNPPQRVVEGIPPLLEVVAAAAGAEVVPVVDLLEDATEVLEVEPVIAAVEALPEVVSLYVNVEA